MKKGSRKASGLVIVLMAMCLSGPAASAASNSTRYLNDPETLPAGLYPALVKALQSDAPSGYEVRERVDAGPGVALAGTGYRAHNAAHGLAIEFGPASLELRSKDGMAWRLEMRLVGYGYGESVRFRANGRQG